MTRPRLFVELCCGSGAVSLKLIGGRYAVPPISYMGGKRGFAHAILLAMGTCQGEGADRLLFCDAGPWGVVWEILADKDRALAVAAIIRGWSDEEPRSLWDRLRSEYKKDWDDWKTAAFLYLSVRQAHGKAIVDTGEKWEAMAGNGKAQGIGFVSDVSPSGARRWCDMSTETTAARVEAVAAWLTSGHFAYRGGYPESGFAPIHAQARPRTATDHGAGPRVVETIACKLDAVDHAPITVYPGRAEDVPIPDDCDGVFCYIDPPYQGTTGYEVKLPRADVLALAQRWNDAGALVCVSEAEPLPLDGWHHLEITNTRLGQKRTFSKQQAEWLTMNRPPAWRPSIQQTLF